MKRLLCLVLPLSVGCTGHFANLARDFGGAVRSESADLSPMLRGIGQVCRKQADLAYLRQRLEAPGEVTLWAERHKALFSGRRESIERRCQQVDAQVTSFLLMYRGLVAYAAGMRALADAQRGDFQDSFRSVGSALAQVGRELRPSDPELSLALLRGSDAINQILGLALSLQSEADLRRAVLAAELPVSRLFDRLDRAAQVYGDELTRYLTVQADVLAQIERRSRDGEVASLLSFYQMAQSTDEQAERMRKVAAAYPLALRGLRAAHDNMVKAAHRRISAREAFVMTQKSLRVLLYDLNDVYDSAVQIYLRGQR